MWAVVQPPAGLLTAPITERVFRIRLCFSLSRICCSSSWLRFRTRCRIFTGFSAVDILRFLFAFVFLSGFPGLGSFARGIRVYFRVIVTAYIAYIVPGGYTGLCPSPCSLSFPAVPGVWFATTWNGWLG